MKKILNRKRFLIFGYVTIMAVVIAAGITNVKVSGIDSQNLIINELKADYETTTSTFATSNIGEVKTYETTTSTMTNQVELTNGHDGDYSYVEFGQFNGEPLVWIAIEERDNIITLLSNKILHSKAFDSRYEKTGDKIVWGSNSWETSDLRNWLNSNDGFLSINNFDDAEIGLIKADNLKIVLSNKRKPEAINIDVGEMSDSNNLQTSDEAYDSAYYKNIVDRVYLLSIKEYMEIKSSNVELSIRDEETFWLRTPEPSTINKVIIASGNKEIDIASIHVNEHGVLPVIRIDGNGVLVKYGEGTLNSPYRIMKSD